MTFIFFVYITIACWLGFLVYWAVQASNVKETVEQQPIAKRLMVMGFMVVGFFLLWFQRLPVSLSQRIIPATTLFGCLAVLCSVSGLALCIWARRTLGRNWSAQVTFKQNHELITSGPYAYVRHPIYTGFGLLFLGSVIVVGHIGAFISLLVIMLGFIIKYSAEEKLMLKHFPDRYPAYMKKVKALIPFVF